MSVRDDMPVCAVREHARRSALAGRPVWANPHLGGQAEIWRIEYLSVPEAERGTRPDLLPKARTRKKKAGRGRAIGRMAGAGVKALGDRCLPGSTPTPVSKLDAPAIKAQINYYEAVLRDSVSPDRRMRAERRLAKLRTEIPCVPKPVTPKPWGEW